MTVIGLPAKQKPRKTIESTVDLPKLMPFIKLHSSQKEKGKYNNPNSTGDGV